MSFRALRVEKGDGAPKARLVTLEDDDLMDGDVTVRVTHSTVNYKDGLAITGKAPVVRVYPLIPGIDFSGVVEASADARFKVGDRVVLNGWGVGESHHGGYSERARVRGDWLIALPDAIPNDVAMAIGTAGYTAMLAVMALERHGLTPEGGEALVTGAAGGVGGVAVALLSSLGWNVIASSGRGQAQSAYLTGLGATEILDRAELAGPGRPLGRERWLAAIDSVGSHTLANVLSQTRYGGVVAACGLAQGMDLPASVAPFILRGVTLAGIDSVMRPRPDREEAWARLAHDLDQDKLAAMTSTAGLEEVPALAEQILAGHVRGRVVIDLAL